MRWAERIALALAAAALTLGLLLPFASLPPFAFGQWDKAEPLVVGLHAAGALSALAFLPMLWSRRGMALACWRHVFVLLPLAIGLWSCLMAPFVSLPILSLAGAPQSGGGAFWQFDLAALVAAARMLRHYPRIWRRLMQLALSSVAAVGLIKSWDWLGGWAGLPHLLIYVASYYSWLGLILPVLLLDKGWSLRERRLLIAASLLVLIAGRSLTAVAAAVMGLVVWHLLRRSRSEARWSGGLAALAGSLLPGLLLVAVPRSWEGVSWADRRSLLSMAGAELQGWHGLDWITGRGWGRTQDVFHQHLIASGQSFWDNSWPFIGSDYFHFHNGLVEALVAIGLPGLVLVALFWLAVPLFCAPEQRATASGFALAMALFSACWFPLALSLPLMALALALLSPLEADEQPTRPWLALAPLLLGPALAVMAFFVLESGLSIGRLKADLKAGKAQPPAIGSDFRGTDLAVAEMMVEVFDKMERLRPIKHERFRPTAAVMTAYLDRRMADSPSMMLRLVGLGLMARLSEDEGTGWIIQDLPAPGQVWERWVDETLRQAPERSDLAISLLSHQALAGRYDLVAARAEAMLGRNPQDPVGLYFKGLSLVVRPSAEDKQAGMTLLRQSVQGGIEQVMPLSPDLRRALGL